MAKKDRRVIKNYEQLMDWHSVMSRYLDWLGKPILVEFKEWTQPRNLNRNRKMWAMLRDVSRQVEWYGRYLSDEDWKNIFSAAVERQDAVPGIDGGMVVLGVSTRDKSNQWFSDLFEIMYAFGAEHGVEWTEPELVEAA